MFGLEKKKETKNVLIVEDDALLAQVLSRVFTEEKFKVVNVMDGLEVMDVAKKMKPDIILLDLILPSLDGFGVLKLLKEDSVTQNIPVIIISNLEEVSDVKSAKVLGAEEYFIKANIQLDKILQFVKKRLKV